MANRRTLLQRHRQRAAVGKAGVRAGTLTEYRVIVEDPKGRRYGRIVTAGNHSAARRRGLAQMRSQIGPGPWTVVGVQRLGG